jgi:outer membrane protein TolC
VRAAVCPGLLLAIHLFATVGIASADALRVEDAVQLALTRNERSRIAELNVTEADAALARARTAFLPVLTASGNDQIRGSGDPTNVATGSLSINQPLFNPSAFPLYAEAREQLDSTKAQSADDKRTLAFDAARAFFTVLLADQVVQAAQRKLDTARANLADTQARAQAQLVSSNDATRAQIDLGGSLRELESDQGTLEAAYVQLEFTINQRVTRAALAPPTALLDAGQKPLPALESLVQMGVSRRPDLVARRHSASAAHDFAEEPLWRLVPSVGVGASVTTTSNAPQNGRATDANVTFNATWILFDAGARYADRRARVAAAEIADLSTSALMRTVDSQVRSSAAQLVSAQQALGAAEQAMTAARKSADETAILYKQDLAKAIELVDANEERFVAEVNYATAQFSVASAYLGLRQALGLDPMGMELQ